EPGDAACNAATREETRGGHQRAIRQRSPSHRSQKSPVTRRCHGRVRACHRCHRCHPTPAGRCCGAAASGSGAPCSFLGRRADENTTQLHQPQYHPPPRPISAWPSGPLNLCAHSPPGDHLLPALHASLSRPAITATAACQLTHRHERSASSAWAFEYHNHCRASPPFPRALCRCRFDQPQGRLSSAGRQWRGGCLLETRAPFDSTTIRTLPSSVLLEHVEKALSTARTTPRTNLHIPANERPI
ncbi:hypothetical protein BDV95DRAFT_634039, partial [Massariosphaeria phaeospora]